MSIETRSGRLKWARERRFASAAAFARAIQVPEVSYRAHENGLRDFREPAARRYAAALGINWSWLLIGDGAPLVGSDQPAEAAEKAGAEKRSGRSDIPVAVLGSDGGSLAARMPIYASTMTITAKPGVETTESSPPQEVLEIRKLAIDSLMRPDPLRHVGAAFAVHWLGDTMLPAYRHGDLLLLHPGRPPRQGNDVLVCRPKHISADAASDAASGDCEYAQFGRLVRWSRQSWVLQRFQPACQFELLRVDWPLIYPLAGAYHDR